MLTVLILTNLINIDECTFSHMSKKLTDSYSETIDRWQTKNMFKTYTKLVDFQYKYQATWLWMLVYSQVDFQNFIQFVPKSNW